MSNKFSDWEFRMLLLREIIFDGSKKELDSLHRAFPDIMVNLNHSDAISLYEYCSNHPTKYRRMISQLKALGIRTKEYVLSKCKNDNNFVVRRVCKELNDSSVEACGAIGKRGEKH